MNTEIKIQESSAGETFIKILGLPRKLFTFGFFWFILVLWEMYNRNIKMKLQKVVVFVNETVGIAHVGIFNMINCLGHQNKNATISALFNRAKSAKKNIEKDYNETTFIGKFNAALLNTEREDWRIEEKHENLEYDFAISLRDTLREAYSQKYLTSGFARNKIVSVNSIYSGPNVELKNASQAKIYKVVTDLCTGLNVNVATMQREVYREYAVRQTITTRRQMWQYIHEAMVENELAVAA